MSKALKSIFFFGLFVSFLPLSSYGATADENVTRIQKAYENIRDIRGSFVQTSILKDLDRTDVYKGDFFIKPPGKMKWAYRGKSAQDVTINNDTVLIYKKGDNQAYKGKFDRETYGQTPVALLGGFGNIREEFNISGRGDNTLVLKPRKSLGNVSSIEVVVTDSAFPIRSFTIRDTYSNVIKIELKDVQLNTGLKDSLFDLTLPKGVNIYEQ